MEINLLQLQGLSILQQLQLEEALLRADERNWCLFNEGCDSAIVMGISGKPELLINPESLQHKKVPVIRRFSGGGTVFVDPHTVFVTWICNSVEAKIACQPEKIMRWTVAFYQESFPHVPIELRENDYVIGDRKCGGNAQYLQKNRWLHHSSLLWDYNPVHMDYLLMPPKMPGYRKERPHAEFICCLKDHFQGTTELKENFLSTLRKKFSVNEFLLSDIQPIMEKEHRKGTHLIPDWR